MSIRFPEKDLRTPGPQHHRRPRHPPAGGGLCGGPGHCGPQKTLLVASENGLGKRTSFGEYHKQGRGGTGVKTMNCTDKTGKVVSAAVVSDEDELMLMTTVGQSVRIKVATVRETAAPPRA